MKIAILGDTHLGMRNASNHFSNHANKFFSEIFYPYLVEHGIKHIIQLGDLFDNRTQISIKAYHACKDVWFDPLVEHGITMHTLLGNHDIFHKSSLKINSPQLLLGREYEDNISIITEPTIVKIDNTNFAMIPWICDENKESVFNFFKKLTNKKADIICGHFEIDGFEMMRGVPGHGGLPRTLFENYECTLSGHYHTRSFDYEHRIQYVGTPYEITFADMHDPKGFTVFDTETRLWEFIRNPKTMFERVLYNDGWSGDISSLKDKSVKLVVEKKTNLYEFDRFVDSVKLAGVYELHIIENFGEVKEEIDGEIEIEDSRSIISAYIDNVDVLVDKDRLKSYLMGLYAEAISE